MPLVLSLILGAFLSLAADLINKFGKPLKGSSSALELFKQFKSGNISAGKEGNILGAWGL